MKVVILESRDAFQVLEVGRYRLVRRVGEGGMGEVFEAIAQGSRGFTRRVAVKRMLPQQNVDGSFARMFLDEALIASYLHHSNIVSVLDYGVAEGAPFQVLEFVDGVHTGRLLKSAQRLGACVPIEIALYLCIEVAHALEHAHTALDAHGHNLGIVHRDVSPTNILVSWSGDVKLADFGIALAHNRTERTQDGSAKGKLLYMAPEQTLRSGVDHRADIFSLGCVLHTLLSGRSPLEGETALMDLLQGSALPLDSSLPSEVRAVVKRATCHAKHKRYTTAGEMASDMGAVLAPRLNQDGRTLLRTFLSELRRADPSLEHRGYTIPSEQVLARSRGRHEFTTKQAPTWRRGWLRLLWLVLSILLILGVSLAVWTRPTHRSQTAPARTVVSRPRPQKVSRLISPSTVPVQTSTSVTASEVPDVGSTPPRVRGPVRKTGKRPAPVRIPDRPASIGLLVIGGGNAVGYEIYVNGLSHGFAPKKVTLPVGSHRVDLRDSSGHVVHQRTIQITASHTASAPLRWLLR